MIIFNDFWKSRYYCGCHMVPLTIKGLNIPHVSWAELETAPTCNFNYITPKQICNCNHTHQLTNFNQGSWKKPTWHSTKTGLWAPSPCTHLMSCDECSQVTSAVLPLPSIIVNPNQTENRAGLGTRLDTCSGTPTMLKHLF